MFGRNNQRSKVAPSHYPRVVFHLIRSSQLIASLVVGAIMSFFIYHLRHDHWSVPWTFIWLSAASLFSVAALGVTVVLHCCVGLSPVFNIAINSFLTILWALSWSLLTWYMSGTLAHNCDVENWNEEAGMMVCRIYKALFVFTLLGLVSTLAALILDLYVRRQQNARGIYRLHDLDSKQQPQATRGPFTHQGQTYAAGGLAEPRESTAWEEPQPRPSTGPYSNESKPMAKQGYSVPEQQFNYDTGYRGYEE